MGETHPREFSTRHFSELSYDQVLRGGVTARGPWVLRKPDCRSAKTLGKDSEVIVVAHSPRDSGTKNGPYGTL